MEVIVSTRNKNKFAEISKILSDAKIKAVSLEEFPQAPKRIKEDGDTFAANASIKALKIAHRTKKLTVADDSGLEVNALAGAPGVYSARFSGKGATYQSNNNKLLKALKDLPNKNQRKARFVCAVAIADAAGIIAVVEGTCPGYIALELKGDKGFGYDPLFEVNGYKKTFAQLSPKLKNQISHRAKAFSKAKKVILKYIDKSKINKVIFSLER
ncbi:MAG: RdgB/HAM1 family non-canonical purine NTP pyrophosphatase [Candidatus Omnitrophica bacterium]|nr:RdgB/HAM1 family non-canonical purine NTP pyrophosphatase [Candidatus Omnitrophota bacterium]